MNKKILVTLGVTGLILANVGFSFATSSNVIEKSKKVDIVHHKNTMIQ